MSAVTDHRARALLPAAITLTLPWPAGKGLSPNCRSHWRVKAKAKALLREAWSWQAKAQGAAKIDAKRLDVRLTFVPPDRRARDLDNMLASCKAGLDGLADVLGVDDRHWSLALSVAPEVGGFVRVRVEVAD